MLRRLRSALSLAVIWAIVWLPFGVLVGLILTRLVNPAQSWRDFFAGLGVWTLLGGLSGFMFALLIALFERRRTLQELSPVRVAVWGALGGAAMPVLATIILLLFFHNVFLASGARLVFAFMGVLGAICATGTLWIARRAVKV